jgi:hypothetical protein
MAGVEALISTPVEWSVRATGVNTTVTATKAVGQATDVHYIPGVSISASAAPVTTVEVQVRKNAGAAVLDAFQLAPFAFAPIVLNYGSHVLQGDMGGDVDVTIPDLGAGVISVAVIKGFTRPR